MTQNFNNFFFICVVIPPSFSTQLERLNSSELEHVPSSELERLSCSKLERLTQF
jgi:hypothetical protein